MDTRSSIRNALVKRYYFFMGVVILVLSNTHQPALWEKFTGLAIKANLRTKE